MEKDLRVIGTTSCKFLLRAGLLNLPRKEFKISHPTRSPRIPQTPHHGATTCQQHRCKRVSKTLNPIPAKKKTPGVFIALRFASPPPRAPNLRHKEPGKEKSSRRLLVKEGYVKTTTGILDSSATSPLLALPSSSPPPTHLSPWNWKHQLDKTS